MADVISLGELLIDFTPVGISEKGNPVFERNPGGGPANMACAYTKLGGDASFIGKVGNDPFGRALKQTLLENQVEVDQLVLSDDYQTTLAFVHLDEKGDRSFSFYRRQGADTMLTYEEVDLSCMDGAKYFFFSSVLMSDGPSRDTSFQLAGSAKGKGLTVVFDPNFRFNLWKNPEDAKYCAQKAMAHSDIVKISEEELTFVTGIDSIPEAAGQLLEEYPIQLLLITLGEKGCIARMGDITVSHPGFAVNTVDTTAAGDSFTGGFLAALNRLGKEAAELTPAELEECVAFANAVGALTTTKKGAISALPTLDEVEALLHGTAK